MPRSYPVFLLCWLLWTSPASAQCVRIVTRTPQDSRTTIRSWGSGYPVGNLRDGRIVVLTAAHTVQTKPDVRVVWQDEEHPAELLGLDHSKTMDVAALAARLDGIRSLSVLQQVSPPPGSWVELEGFPGHRPLRRLKAQWRRDTMLVIPPLQIESGMSGGAVIYGGHLAGVITGLDNKNPSLGAQTPAPAIAEWLVRTIGYVPEVNPAGQPMR